MKTTQGIMAVGLLTGCGNVFAAPPDVAQCEKYILAKLQKPNTYKRVESASLRLNDSKTEYWEVGIDYTFVDASNTNVQGHQLCDFPLVDGKPDTSKYIDFDRENRK